MKKFTLTTLLMLLFAFVAGAENFPQKKEPEPPSNVKKQAINA